MNHRIVTAATGNSRSGDSRLIGVRKVIAVIVLVSGAVLAGGADFAAAWCAGPAIDFPREVDRGGSLVVTGTAWGDSCNDVGPLPPGVGVLGQPAAGVALVVVQGSSEWVVGRASADTDYRFEVTVDVPPEAEPGPAQLVARHRGRDAFSVDPNFLITGTPTPSTVAVGETSSTATAVDATVIAGSRPPPAQGDSSSGPWGWIIAAALAVALATAGVALTKGRRQ